MTSVPFKVGDTLAKGAELGNMQFGGSTVITLFPPGSVLWDDDVRYASSLPVESYVQLGQRVGLVGRFSGNVNNQPNNADEVNNGLGAGLLGGMIVGIIVAAVLSCALFACAVRYCQGGALLFLRLPKGTQRTSPAVEMNSGLAYPAPLPTGETIICEPIGATKPGMYQGIQYRNP